MKRYSFLLAYILLMGLPSLFVLYFVRHSIPLNPLILVILISFFIGGILEIWAVRQGRKDKFYIWEYNSETTLNKKLMGIAVEDLTLFLFLTPVFVIAVWEASKQFINSNNTPLLSILLTGFFVIALTYFVVYKFTKPK